MVEAESEFPGGGGGGGGLKLTFSLKAPTFSLRSSIKAPTFSECTHFPRLITVKAQHLQFYQL